MAEKLVPLLWLQIICSHVYTPGYPWLYSTVSYVC